MAELYKPVEPSVSNGYTSNLIMRYHRDKITLDQEFGEKENAVFNEISAIEK